MCHLFPSRKMLPGRVTGSCTKLVEALFAVGKSDLSLFLLSTCTDKGPSDCHIREATEYC